MSSDPQASGHRAMLGRESANLCPAMNPVACLCYALLAAMAARAVPPPEILPTPKNVALGTGRLEVRDPCVVAGPEAGYAAEAIAHRLHAPVVDRPRPGRVAITLRLEPAAPFALGLGVDQRPEAYRLTIDSDGVAISAPESEGLLRGAATLLQLLGSDPAGGQLPCISMVDWPDFRWRCASDWLLNVECNRWAYERGDGPAAYLARIERKLDFCFLHKINQVWFDGFGWNTNRFPGYAPLMRQCTRHARRRGIRLTFAGYGGGYGTAYQQSDVYRHGYFGQTFLNRRPYPGGARYSCRGIPGSEISRVYGTCLSNEGLACAKLDELKRFVAAVEPGFLYIHDTDTGTYASSQAGWRMRCDECRRRWPSDEIESTLGQAGAMAHWCAQVRDALQTVNQPGYQARRDLTLIFTSPLYAHGTQEGDDTWRREIDYFRTMSRLMGPSPNVQFGVRELFHSTRGTPKVAELRAALDEVGHGHTPHVISFGGGDNYLSDDLRNYSGALAHLFRGAGSVCLSNGSVHEEPVQVLNAELLWSGAAQGHYERPADGRAAHELWTRLATGRWHSEPVFGPGRLFERICHRLWGAPAGASLYRAYMAGDESGDGPVCRVWFSVTRDLGRLRSATPGEPGHWEALNARWIRRLRATGEALAHARRAAALSPDEDIAWLTRSLEVGRRFGEAMVIATALKVRPDAAARSRLAEVLDDLESHIRSGFRLEKTDVLGGDPGCWLETVARLRETQ